MSTKVYHSLALALSLSVSLSLKKSHRTIESERTEQGKCNDTATITTIK
jgi:hypothetical protein